MQQQRRSNPYPLTWEIPVLVLVGVLLVAVLGVHTGRGLATLVAGHGWTWPDHLELFRSLPALLVGDLTAGLPPGTLPASAHAPLTPSIILSELLALAGLIAGARLVLDRWGPQRLRGMATHTQVDAVLGVRHLHQVRHLIRPDLYPRKARP